MGSNTEYFIYCDLEANTLPDKALVQSRRIILEKMQIAVPHLLHKKKRIMPNQTISWLHGLRLGKSYPFRNGDQKDTKGAVVWTDYFFNYWPLLMTLLSIYSDMDYKSLIDTLKPKDQQKLNWDELLELVSHCENRKELVTTDELDRWYDEISTTLLQATSYHALYRWFGDELQQIGYDAFDFYMAERDGAKAWHKALKKHVNAIQNLPDEVGEHLMTTYWFPLLKFS